jgi:TPR repeat protein
MRTYLALQKIVQRTTGSTTVGQKCTESVEIKIEDTPILTYAPSAVSLMASATSNPSSSFQFLPEADSTRDAARYLQCYGHRALNLDAEIDEEVQSLSCNLFVCASLQNGNHSDDEWVQARHQLETSADAAPRNRHLLAMPQILDIALSYAYVWLGYMYGVGLGVAVDQQKAFGFYKAAASLGVGEAQVVLGDIYYYGMQNCIQKDEREAYGWFESAASDKVISRGVRFVDSHLNWLKRRPRIKLAGGNRPPYQVHAMKQLSRICLSTVDKDAENPRILHGVWFLFKAAMHGQAQEKLLLGSFLLVGFESLSDQRKARFWLQKSDHEGNLTAKKILRYCATSETEKARAEARRVLRNEKIPTVSKKKTVELLGMNLLFSPEPKSESHVEACKSDSALIPLHNYGIFSQFPESSTASRLGKAEELHRKAIGLQSSSKVEDMEMYVENLVEAYLTHDDVFNYYGIDASVLEHACNVVQSKTPLRPENCLIGKVIVRTTRDFSDDRVVEAIDLMNEAIRIVSRRNVTSKAEKLRLARLHHLAGRFQLLNKELDVASKSFSSAVDIGENEALMGQARCYMQNKEPGKAVEKYIEYLKRASTCDDSISFVCYELATAMFNLKRVKESCYYFEQGIESEMYRLFFQKSVSSNYRDCLFGLYLSVDTSDMTACNKCFRIQTSNLLRRCELCQEVNVSGQDDMNSFKRLKHKLEQVQLGNWTHKMINEVVRALQSIQEKFTEVDKLFDMIHDKEKHSGGISVEELDEATCMETALAANVHGRDEEAALTHETLWHQSAESFNDHVVSRGAAGSLFAVSLRNPPDSVAMETLAVGERVAVSSISSETCQESTYAGSGASGKVAIFIEYDKRSLFHAPARNKSFTGRFPMLDKLKNTLQCYGGIGDTLCDFPFSGCKFAALSGLGGTGKTSVAVEYAWRNAEYYTGGCYWISADNPEESIRDVASNLNCDADISVTGQLRAVLSHILSISRPLLVVVDNMDSQEMPSLIESLLCGPWRLQPGRRNMLVTSRCRPDLLRDMLHIEQSVIYTVDPFEEVESIDFLENRTREVQEKIKFSVELARNLSRKVRHLPLALEQAACYLLFTGCSLKDYTAAYQKQRTNLLKRRKAKKHLGDDKSAEHRLAVHTTWKLNFDRIQEEVQFGKVAYSFVQTAAFIASEKIPFEFVQVMDEETFRSDPTALRSIVSLLTELSLFREDSGKLLSVHRLVQDILRESVSNDIDMLKETLRSAISALVTCLKNCKPPNFMEYAMWANMGKFERWGILSSHALVLQDHALSSANLLRDQFYDLVCTELAVLLNNASIYASIIGRQSMAKQLDCQKLRLLVMLGETVCDSDLSDLTSVTLPLPVKVQQNLRRGVGDMTMTGTKQLADVPLKSKRKKGCLPVDSYSPKVPVDDDLKNKLMATVQECSFVEAQEVVCQLTGRLSTSCETTGKRFAILSCRAQAYLLSGILHRAVDDAKECISLYPKEADGYEILAQIFSLIKCSSLRLAHCMAAIAKHLEAKSSTMPWFQLAYPGVQSVRVETMMDLQAILDNQKLYRGKTVLLSNVNFSHYHITINEDINFVSIGSSTMSLRRGVSLVGINACWINMNVSMDSSCIDVCPQSSLYFLHCRLKSLGSTAAVVVKGSACTDKCSITDCASTGVIVRGPSSMGTVMSCIVKGNQEVGLIASEGGCLLAVGNIICENKAGLRLGPLPGHCLLQQNFVFMNRYAGIQALHYDETVSQLLTIDKTIKKSFESMPFQKNAVPSTVINENEICENGVYGVTFFGLRSRFGVVVLKNNLINGNAFWGLASMSEDDPKEKMSVVVSCNTFRGNKYGGLRIDETKGKRHKVDGNVIEHNPLAFSTTGLAPSTLDEYKTKNTIANNEKTINYPKAEPLWHADQCCHCRSPIRRQRDGIWCRRCNASVYCSTKCSTIHLSTHDRVCKFISSRYSVTAKTNDCPLARQVPPGYNVSVLRIPLNKRHKRGLAFAPRPEVGGSRFVVKLQMQEEKFSPHDPIEVYDQSETVSTYIESAQLYHVLVNCGATTELQGTGKKAYFWAVLEDLKTVRIFFDRLVPYTDDW